MKKCIVITGPYVYDVEQSANKMLNNGWMPLGGVAIEKESKNVFAYCLAMMHENYVENQVEEESAIFDVVSKLVDLIDDAADEHGSIGAVFTPEYQTAYKQACLLLGRDPREMLV